MKGIEKNKKLTFASLFSGIGGADIAATAVGWEHKFWCEWDPFCQTVLKYWFNNSIGYNDITKTDFTGWRGKIDILHASPPCQSVSVAGKRKGETDDRFLWGDAIRALDEIRPTWFTFENVAGIESMVESVPYIRMARKGGDHGENCESCIGQSYQRGVLYGILEKIRLQGYEVQVFNIPACAVGAPHERKRIWIVGHLIDANSERRKHGGDNREERPVRDEQSWYTPENIRYWSQWVSEFGENGKDGSATDSACKQGERNGSKQRENRASKQMQHRGRGGKDGGFWRSEDFWRDFPTQSPVRLRYDGVSRNVARYINSDVYDAIKKYIRREDLSSLREIFHEKEIRKKIGRLYEIPEPDLLLEILQRTQERRGSKKRQERLSSFSEKTSGRLLQYLRKYGTFTCSPLGQKYKEQFSREFGNSLPVLSHEIALATKKIIEECESTAEWVRQQGVKACGNALVPQVLYQFYNAINKIEQIKNK